MLLSLLFACAPEFKVLTPTDDSGDIGPTEGDDSGLTEEEEALWAGATLKIDAPESGAFLPLGEDANFEASVYDAEGNLLDFDAITWATDQDSTWSLLGASVADATLGVGRHALTASAVLPNGDRLAYTVGGVLVQSAYAGVYAGTLSMDAAYDSYAVGCAGAASVIIDAAGTAVTGDAGCLLSLQGFDLDAQFNLDMENADGDVSGAMNLDLQFFEYPLDAAGSVTEDGEFTINFEASLDIGAPVTLTGELNALRISREVPQ